MDLDRQLFLTINQLPHNPLWDFLMLGLSRSVLPLVVLFFLTFAFLTFLRLKDLREAVFLFLAFGVGFLLLAGGLKGVFARGRPYLTVPGTIVVDKTETGYSFPSGHSFSVALLSTLVARKKDKLLFFFIPFSLLVGLSRIYLGVHFPADVAVGLALGFLYGLFLNAIVDRFIEHKIFKILKFHLD